jgi:CheY-like chemotaxis protein
LTKQVVNSNAILANKGVELQSDIQLDEVGYVIGDPHRFSQILMNFMSNAAKFTLEGHILISAKVLKHGNVSHPPSMLPTAKPSDDLLELEFRCLDSGVGMSKETLQSLFQPFRQADSTTTRIFGGTGLGLVISKNLVSGMGGEIAINSTSNKGSEIVWTLIFQKSSAPPVDIRPSLSLSEIEKDRTLSILLAEDNNFNQQIISKLLSALSCKVTIASNGQEAVTMANEHHYDLILMDVQMPVLSGLDAARTLINLQKKDKIARLPPIVALTANADSLTKEECFSAGMTEVLTKPIQINLLKALLRRIRDTSEL